MKITFFIDATITKEDSGFVTCCCLLDHTLVGEVFNEENINDYYEAGRLLLSSVPFDAIVTFDETLITFGDAITASIEQILVDSSIENLKRKLLVIDENIDLNELEYEIIYFETVGRYVGVLEESIVGNSNINIELKLIDCDNINLQKCPGFKISSIQNNKFLAKSDGKNKEE